MPRHCFSLLFLRNNHGKKADREASAWLCYGGCIDLQKPKLKTSQHPLNFDALSHPEPAKQVR